MQKQNRIHVITSTLLGWTGRCWSYMRKALQHLQFQRSVTGEIREQHVKERYGGREAKTVAKKSF